jgi:hypothetical protein
MKELLVALAVAAITLTLNSEGFTVSAPQFKATPMLFGCFNPASNRVARRNPCGAWRNDQLGPFEQPANWFSDLIQGLRKRGMVPDSPLTGNLRGQITASCTPTMRTFPNEPPKSPGEMCLISHAASE